MGDIKSYNDKRFLIDYTAAMDDSYCVLWAIPVGIAKVLVGLLEERGSWRSTYVKEYHRDYYIAPSIEEHKLLVDFVGAWLGEISMSNCMAGLLTVLTDIRDAIRAQANCCQNSSNGLHMVDLGEGDLVYGNEQPLTPPTSFGGEGEFEDEAAFDEHRCKAANNIVAGLILSLNSWSTLLLVNLIAGALVIAFFVANPPLGVMLAIGMVGLSYGVLLTISNYIADNREAWVCAIYNADDYQTFLANVDSRVDELVISLDLGAFELQITELIHSVLDTDTFNKMFTVIGLPEVQNPIDCDVCAPEECATIILGTLSDGDLCGDDFTLSADGPKTYGPDTYWDIHVQLFSPQEIDFTLTGFTQPSFSSYILDTIGGSAVYDSSTQPPADNLTGQDIYLVSRTEFTCRIQFI